MSRPWIEIKLRRAACESHSGNGYDTRRHYGTYSGEPRPNYVRTIDRRELLSIIHMIERPAKALRVDSIALLRSWHAVTVSRSPHPSG